jgi:hypothetical protein
MYGLLCFAFSAMNAVQINNWQNQIEVTSDKLATLTRISQIQEDHLENLKIENLAQDSIMLCDLGLIQQFWQQ